MARLHEKGATDTDHRAHSIAEFFANPSWHGTTVVDDYAAFYHEERLYSVRHLKKGIISLVYARNPYDAIEMVRNLDKPL